MVGCDGECNGGCVWCSVMEGVMLDTRYVEMAIYIPDSVCLSTFRLTT